MSLSETLKDNFFENKFPELPTTDGKIPKGLRVSNLEGTGGYEVLQDILPGEMMKSEYFKGYGDEPDPVDGELIPMWFFTVLWDKT